MVDITLYTIIYNLVIHSTTMSILSKPISLSPTPTHLLLLLSLYLTYLILNRYLIQPLLTPLRNLSGPRKSRKDGWGIVIGHLRPIIKGEPGVVTGEWIGRYGGVFSESRGGLGRLSLLGGHGGYFY